MGTSLQFSLGKKLWTAFGTIAGILAVIVAVIIYEVDHVITLEHEIGEIDAPTSELAVRLRGELKLTLADLRLLLQNENDGIAKDHSDAWLAVDQTVASLQGMRPSWTEGLKSTLTALEGELSSARGLHQDVLSADSHASQTELLATVLRQATKMSSGSSPTLSTRPSTSSRTPSGRSRPARPESKSLRVTSWKSATT